MRLRILPIRPAVCLNSILTVYQIMLHHTRSFRRLAESTSKLLRLRAVSDPDSLLYFSLILRQLTIVLLLGIRGVLDAAKGSQSLQRDPLRLFTRIFAQLGGARWERVLVLSQAEAPHLEVTTSSAAVTSECYHASLAVHCWFIVHVIGFSGWADVGWVRCKLRADTDIM